MNKKKFEEMIPDIKEIIEMVPDVRGKEEDEEEITTGFKVDSLEELLDQESPRRKFYKYLSGFEHDELKIIQSFMLTGRYILNGSEKFDKKTLIEMFEENFDRPSHQNDKSAMVSYISEKTLQLDRYLNKGLEAFKKINN